MEQKDEPKPVEKPAEKVDEKAKTKTLEQPQKEEKQPAKKGEGWIKFLRILIWCAVTILLTVGLQLRALSETSSAYADGSQTAKASLGNTLFWIGLILGIANLAWGAYRWFSRLVKEKWKAGKKVLDIWDHHEYNIYCCRERGPHGAARDTSAILENDIEKKEQETVRFRNE